MSTWFSVKAFLNKATSWTLGGAGAKCSQRLQAYADGSNILGTAQAGSLIQFRSIYKLQLVRVYFINSTGPYRVPFCI